MKEGILKNLSSKLGNNLKIGMSVANIGKNDKDPSEKDVKIKNEVTNFQVTNQIKTNEIKDISVKN